MMSKIWTNEDTIIWLSRKHCGKRRNCWLRAISSFPTMFFLFPQCLLLMHQNGYLWSKGLMRTSLNFFLWLNFSLVRKLFNPFWNKSLFLHVYSVNLSKTRWEKGESAHKEQFLFCHRVFYSSGELPAIFILFP